MKNVIQGGFPLGEFIHAQYVLLFRGEVFR